MRIMNVSAGVMSGLSIRTPIRIPIGLLNKTTEIIAKQLNYDFIEFPVTVKQYNKIEKQNNININVIGYENKQHYLIYISKEQYNKTLNLLNNRG